MRFAASAAFTSGTVIARPVSSEYRSSESSAAMSEPMSRRAWLSRYAAHLFGELEPARAGVGREGGTLFLVGEPQHPVGEPGGQARGEVAAQRHVARGRRGRHHQQRKRASR